MLAFRYSKNSRLPKTLGNNYPDVSRYAFTMLPWLKTPGLGKLNGFKLDKFGKFHAVAVVGIGGSSLGAKALTSALGAKNIVFIDNIDPDFVAKKLSQLTASKTLFVFISKSGETMEVLSLASIISAKFRPARLKPAKNMLVITDSPAGTLGKFAKKRGIRIFISPRDVPGRFSVLSAVGLIPAALSKVPVRRVLQGARKTSRQQALKLAQHQYLHTKKNRNITVVFPYSERLSDFADWYIQLLSESIGKSRKVGITPIKALGVKDQHSQLQLFLDGPDDKFYILLNVDKHGGAETKIPGKKFSLNKLFNAEYDGVRKALLKRNRPFVEIQLPEINPETLGELFYFFELEIAFLGAFFKVNIENQPAVELSKKFVQNALK